jgi:hypothetical protein
MAVEVHRTIRDPNEVRRVLKRFEARYGVDSREMDRAFRDDCGRFVETRDFREWNRFYKIGLRTGVFV